MYNVHVHNSTQASARKDNPKPRDLTLVYFYNKNYTENQQTFSKVQAKHV